MNPPAQKSALGLFLPILAASLFWWKTTDRLDLPKLWLGLGLVLAVLLFETIRRKRFRQELWTFVLTGALAFALLFDPENMIERVEIWALWLFWLGLFGLGRGVREDALASLLSRLALAISALAWLQAAGLPLFNAELSGFEGRRVVACLGGPGHLGWTLALLLPWLAHHAKTHLSNWAAGAALAFVIGALVLSGARTAWVMAALALPFGLGWPGLRRTAWLAGLILFGVLLAVGLDLLGDKARLSDRIDDITETDGTAQGRAYLWRVHGSALEDWLTSPLGYGPEGFQRRWPDWQRSYLKAHPEDKRFRTDLRHAHADLVEIGSDLGPAALLGLLVLFGFALWRIPPEGSRWSGPALGCLVAGLAGGLAAPVVFFAPSAGLVVASLGLRLGPPRRFAVPGSRLLILGLLGLALFVGAKRILSERNRTQATELEAQGRLEIARVLVEQASGLDSGNLRAWILRARICRKLNDPSCACASVDQAQRRLPSDALQRRHKACQSHGRWW